MLSIIAGTLAVKHPPSSYTFIQVIESFVQKLFKHHILILSTLALKKILVELNLSTYPIHFTNIDTFVAFWLLHVHVNLRLNFQSVWVLLQLNWIIKILTSYLHVLFYVDETKISAVNSQGHAVGRDAFLDHKMIVPLSELVSWN